VNKKKKKKKNHANIRMHCKIYPIHKSLNPLFVFGENVKITNACERFVDKRPCIENIQIWVLRKTALQQLVSAWITWFGQLE